MLLPALGDPAWPVHRYTQLSIEFVNWDSRGDSMQAAQASDRYRQT